LKIYKKYGSRFTSWQACRLRWLGLEEKLVPHEITTLTVCQSRLKLATYLDSICKHPSFETVFSRDEMEHAEYLEISPASHFTYPIGDEPKTTRNSTYEVSELCANCGAGFGSQLNGFKVQSKPKWKRRSVSGLHWFHDELFVTREAFDRVLEPYCEGFWPVLNGRGEVQNEIVQLKVRQSHVEVHGLGKDSDTCTHCGRGRHTTSYPGYFPNLVTNVKEDGIFRINSWFGSGYSSRRPLICSAEVYQAITKAKLKGIDFRPCTK
jgi:hypothetical protein